MVRLVFPFLALPGYAAEVPRPALWLRVVGPRGEPSLPIPGLLDTGSLTTFVPETLAADVGVRPRPGPPFLVSIGGGTVKARPVGEVLLRIRGRVWDEIGEWRTLDIPSRVLVVEAPLLQDLALLGLRGFLDRIDEFTVRARQEVFEISRG